MNLLYLSPHFPENFYLFALRAAQQGIKVLGITDRNWSDLPHDLANSLHDHERISSFNNKREVLDATHRLSHRNGKIHWVESHLEPWLEIEAAIRHEFLVPGLQPPNLDKVKRKSVMKKVFAHSGCRVAKSCLLNSSNDQAVYHFLKENPYPIIIKPDCGVGAIDTHKIESDEQLESFLKNRAPIVYIVEEFIDGQIVTFDGFCDYRGEVVFCTSHQYRFDARQIANEGIDFYYYNVRELDPDLAQRGYEAIRSLGIHNKFFHLEFFRCPDESLVAIEINLRPPGGLSTDMMNFAHDIDIYNLWAQALLQENSSFRYERKYHCAHVSRRDRFYDSYFYSHEELCEKYASVLCHYQRLNPLYAQVMGEHAYLVRSPHMEEIHEIARNFHKRA